MTERLVSHNLPLSEAITIAAQVVGEVMHGRSLGEVLEQLSAQERPIVQSLTFDALRKWTSSQELIKEFVPKTPPPETAYLLSVAIALFLHGEQKAYAVHTIVDQAVEACGQYDKTLYAKGMVNAVLRKVSQKLQAVVDKGYSPDPISMYYPAWWRANLKKSYPKEWQAIGFQQAQRAPLILRVNERQHTRDQYQAMLSRVGIASKTIDTLAGIPLPSALILEEAVPVSDLPEFYSGAVSVQDAGAQLAAILLNPQAGDLILDACAAPGGKTAHLLELADADVVALEIDKERLTRIGGNLDRLGLHSERVQILWGDASQPSWWDGRSFDKILLDAPCSASGIVARHPDIPFLRRASDIAQLQQKQQGILAQAWQMLKPDGVLLYITCSIFPEEGEDQAKWFAAEYPNALRLSAPGQILPSATNDGFYYALFKKNGS